MSEQGTMPPAMGAAQAPPTAESSMEPPQLWTPPRPPLLVILALAALLLIAIAAILQLWGVGPFAGSVERTDNALVRGRTSVIAPQVSGYVARVLVRDYDRVERGQVLALIEDGIYRARVEQARANLDAQLAAFANSRQARAARTAGIASQTATIADAEAQLLKAKADMARAVDLVKDGSISVRERDQTSAALAQAEARLRQANAGEDIAREDLRTVDVGKGGLAAQVEAARAQVHLAEIDLMHTVIRAPERGDLGEVHVRLGQFVTNGTELMQLVPPDRWVIAQYKEAQTDHMAIGQLASFTVDALGGRRLHGRVVRISPATGWEFAVLKPDNATGNFVKIPQRIGILIVVDPNQPLAARLRPGMSVETRIDTDGR
jgi:multidrug resistance efflux pump